MKLALIVSVLLNLCSVIPALAQPEGAAETSNNSLSLFAEEWAPFSFEVNGKAQGFAVDVVEAIQNRLKDQSPIQVVPWTRGFREAKSKPNIVLFTMIRSKEREKLFTLLGPLGQCETSLYGLEKTLLPIHSLQDAKSLVAIAAIQDSVFATALERAGFKNIQLTKNPEQEARLLAAGRVDLIANDPGVIEAAFKKIGRPDLVLKKYLTIEKSEFYISFSKGTSPATIKAWKSALEEIKQDGTFAHLVHKWTPDKAVLPEVRLVGFSAE